MNSLVGERNRGDRQNGQTDDAGPKQSPILSGQTAKPTSSNNESSIRIEKFPESISQGANQQKPFPQALMEMLSQEDPEVITWLPSGDAFLVRNSKKFVDLVLPKFFNQTKITSFQRQLNLYGFRRFVDGPNMGAYHHRLFRRDEPELSKSMSRKKRIRKRPTSNEASPQCVSVNHTSKVPKNVEIDSPSSRRSLPAISPVNSGITIMDPSFEAAKRSATTTSAVPSTPAAKSPLSGYSIIVCDHMNKAVAEVAHYSSIPCDLQSFALGVASLLVAEHQQVRENILYDMYRAVV